MTIRSALLARLYGILASEKNTGPEYVSEAFSGENAKLQMGKLRTRLSQTQWRVSAQIVIYVRFFCVLAPFFECFLLVHHNAVSWP